MEDGSLKFDGDGWLKDSNGNYILDKESNRIGAEGIETGLLNLINGMTSGKRYGSFTDERIAALFRCQTLDKPRSRVAMETILRRRDPGYEGYKRLELEFGFVDWDATHLLRYQEFVLPDRVIEIEPATGTVRILEEVPEAYFVAFSGA